MLTNQKGVRQPLKLVSVTLLRTDRLTFVCVRVNRTRMIMAAVRRAIPMTRRAATTATDD